MRSEHVQQVFDVHHAAAIKALHPGGDAPQCASPMTLEEAKERLLELAMSEALERPWYGPSEMRDLAVFITARS